MNFKHPTAYLIVVGTITLHTAIWLYMPLPIALTTQSLILLAVGAVCHPSPKDPS